MGKNVAVFVDVANIFYAAKAAGVDIDYVTLLKASSAGRDLVRAYAYTGLDPDNENQRNFHDFLRRHGYRVVSKDIRKYGDGKVKANLDIELVVDMMKTARNLDVAIVVSGDGDFAPAIRAVQEQGVRVEVVSFRGNTSSDLMDVADLFTDITQIAKVEKGSSRSGRRVADDDADLSMTEVPDKQSEGTGERGRGRGRTRRTTTATTTRTRARSTAVAAADNDAPLVVMPGEKLSRAATAPLTAPSEVAANGEPDDVEEGEELETVAADGSSVDLSEEGRRRRRRRGGRGRGRGRGREDGEVLEGEGAPARAASDDDLADEGEGDDVPVPTRRPVSAFGSVWDSQIGISASRSTPVLDSDEEDLEEPAVPEYLIAERRARGGQGGGLRGGGGRGRGGAYAAALDRERFGGGRGSTPSRFAEPAPRREGGYGRPDRPERGDRDDRGNRGGDRGSFRPAPRPAPRSSSDEPWSEVPPEIEAMLRAQIGSRPAAPRREPAPVPASADDASATGGEVPEASPARRPARRSPVRRAAPAEASETAAAGSEAPVAEKPAGRSRARVSRTAAGAPEATGEAPTAKAAPRPARSTTRTPKAAPAAAADAPSAAPEAEAAAPKRRATRRKADPSA